MIDERIYNDLCEIAGKENCKINEKMSKHTSFNVGGNADYFVTVKNAEILKKILYWNKDINIPITVVGNGTNLLVLDNGIRGIVIKYVASSVKILDKDVVNNVEISDENIVKVEAGAMNGMLAQVLLKNELSGFEFASGIPGTVGGAIYMNAGAYGSEIKDIVKEVSYIDLDDCKIHNKSVEECEFGYRSSVFSKINAIILEATFVLQKSSYNDIKNKMDEYKKKRYDSQPLDKPNAGSTFKRGNDFITAKLIDEAGLKGYRIGGAEVSTKHAGFIVNAGNANAKDILDLIKYVQDEVYKKFNKKIEVEVRVIGE